MPRTRKSHPPSLKAKVAVEAIKAHKDGRPDRADVRRPPDPGRRLEETGAGRLAGHLRLQALDRYFRFYNHRRPQ